MEEILDELETWPDQMINFRITSPSVSEKKKKKKKKEKKKTMFDFVIGTAHSVLIELS